MRFKIKTLIYAEDLHKIINRHLILFGRYYFRSVFGKRNGMKTFI